METEPLEKQRRVAQDPFPHACLPLTMHCCCLQGVPVLLYEHLLRELERKAKDYLSKLSGGELVLSLNIQKNDGELTKVECDVIKGGKLSLAKQKKDEASGASGGQWSRIRLALLLAYADSLMERLCLSCNLLVLDEQTQQMDANGRAATMAMLPTLSNTRPKDTIIVIENGLSDKTGLVGDAKAKVDRVEMKGGVSQIKLDVPQPMEE